MTTTIDLESKISKHFTWKEALLLPSWGVYHNPTQEEVNNIIKMAKKMDAVRDLIGKPIKIHCWIRPVVANCPGSPHHGENYNAAAGSTATRSAHIMGKAVDWSCGDNCDDVRDILEPNLEMWGLRMERKPGSNWVHLDCADVPPGGHRYFIP